MEEKGKQIVTENNIQKLSWEAPQLISLDKGKTEGGFRTETYEDTTYSNPQS